MDDESGESMKPTVEVPLVGLGCSELEVSRENGPIEHRITRVYN